MPVDASIYQGLNLPGQGTGLATLGDLQALKLVREQREAATAKAQADADKIAREQQKAAVIQGAVKKYQRPDGSIDRKGLLAEVTAFDPNRIKTAIAAGTDRTQYNSNYKDILARNEDHTTKALRLGTIAKDPEHWQDMWEYAKHHDVEGELTAMGLTPDFDPSVPARITEFLIGPQKPEQKAYQSKEVMLNGKRTTVNFDPHTGEYLDQSGKPVTGVSPIPPVSAGGAGGTGAQGGLTPDAVDFEAAKYRVLGASSIPTRVGEQDRLRIMNAAAAQSKQLGVTPVGGIQKQLATKADQTSLNQLRKLASSAEASESKAIGQADIVADLSKKVPRTFSPLINRALLSGKREVLGDANATLLANALTTFTSEYAKIIEGSTGSVAASSDSARKAAERLASANMNPETLQKTLDLMKREMRLTLQGYDASIEHVMDRIGSPTAAGATPAGGSARDPMGIR